MSGKLVTLAIYDNVPLSDLARLRLEDAGISVRVENAEIVNALWHYGSALGGVRLIVDEEHAAAAQALIADIHQSSLLSPDADVEDQGPARCLSCGADFPVDSDRCAACGWSFADDAEPAAAEDADSDNDPAARADKVRRNEPPLKPRFAQVRDVGRPFISLWVAITIAGFVMAILTCVLTMLDDMFR